MTPAGYGLTGRCESTHRRSTDCYQWLPSHTSTAPAGSAWRVA